MKRTRRQSFASMPCSGPYDHGKIRWLHEWKAEKSWNQARALDYSVPFPDKHDFVISILEDSKVMKNPPNAKWVEWRTGRQYLQQGGAPLF